MKIENLSIGGHSSPEQGVCIMEFVSILAGEPFSDHPKCASKSITRFCIWINDKGDQTHRDNLLILAPKIVGTKDPSKEPMRAKIFSEFAFWCEEKSPVRYARATSYEALFAANCAICADRYPDRSDAYAEECVNSTIMAATCAVEGKFRKEIIDHAIKTLERVLAV